MWLPLNLGRKGTLGLSIIDFEDSINAESNGRFSVAVMEASVDYQDPCFSDALPFKDDFGEHEIVHALVGICYGGNNLMDCIESCIHEIEVLGI
jgi:hypothetical protein